MGNNVKELGTSNFNEFINNDYVLVDILATWCGPCKTLSPIIDELSFEMNGTIEFGKLFADDDSNKEIISELGVRNVPTLLLYKNGVLVDKNVGAINKQQLIEFISKNNN